MQTAFRGAINNKPPSTWKTGFTRETKVMKEDKTANTADLSKLEMMVAEDELKDIDPGTKKYNRILQSQRQRKLARKGFVAADAK